MRVLILAASDVDAALAHALAGSGHQVRLLRPDASDVRRPSEERGGLTLTHAGEYPPMIAASETLSRALQANLALLDRGSAALADARFDVVHAGSAGLAYAATAFRRLFGLPVVATLGPPARGTAAPLRQMAWWLAIESSRIVVSNRARARSVAEAFAIEERKIVVVSPSRAAAPAERDRSLATRIARVYEAAVAEHARRTSHDAPDARLLRRMFEREIALAPAR